MQHCIHNRIQRDTKDQQSRRESRANRKTANEKAQVSVGQSAHGRHKSQSIGSAAVTSGCSREFVVGLSKGFKECQVSSNSLLCWRVFRFSLSTFRLFHCFQLDHVKRWQVGTIIGNTESSVVKACTS